MEDTGGLTNPQSWAQAILTIGPSYAVIFALLAILGWLAFKGVPAVMDLTLAINQNTSVVTHAIEQGTVAQQKINENEAETLRQHGEMIGILKQQDVELNDLMADKYSRDAINKLHEGDKTWHRR